MELKLFKVSTDRLNLIKELDDTKKQLVTALKNFNGKDFGSSLNIYEETLKNSGEIDYLKAENLRIIARLEKNQEENSKLVLLNQELMATSSLHEQEKAEFNENSAKIFAVRILRNTSAQSVF
jgi:hypothetical protein